LELGIFVPIFVYFSSLPLRSNSHLPPIASDNPKPAEDGALCRVHPSEMASAQVLPASARKEHLEAGKKKVTNYKAIFLS
jgi:hypothetical protein